MPPRVSDDVGEQLAGWGKVITLETQGRRSGKPVRTAVGYVEEPGGTLLIAAGAEDTAWARNLEANPRALVTVADRTAPMLAEPLSPRDAAAAVTALILRYGTPAERLGRGPAFRLRPAPPAP